MHVFLDRYISTSAMAIRRYRLLVSSEREATPRDTVMGRSSGDSVAGTHSLSTASRMRYATSRAPSTPPFNNRTNSSPP